MRKVFWCSLAGGVMLAGGVFTVAFIAARDPQSLTGRVVLGAGQAALSMNPLTAYSSALARLEKVRKGEPDAGKDVAEEVAGGEEQAEVAEGVIQIPETEPACPEPVFDHLVMTPRAAEAVECPAAPVAMPFCTDEEESEPAAQAKTCTCEKLPLPSIEADEEEQEDAQQGASAIDRLFRLFDHATHKAVEGAVDPVEPAAPAAAPGQVPECREDPNAYQHHSGCPAMGGHCIVPRTPQPVKALPAAPAANEAKGGEEASELADPGSHSSALRAIRRFSMRGVEDRVPMHPEVDTMEFRISDGQLYDLGPGGL